MDVVWEDLSELFFYVELRCGFYFVREGEYNDKLVFILDGVLCVYYLDIKGDFYNKIFFIENIFVVFLVFIF